jgi:hypothetical protein
VILAAAIGQHVLDEIRDDVFGFGTVSRQAHVLEYTPRVGRHRAVDRLFRQLVEVVRENVDELMAEIAEPHVIH